jgi:hypothetical protein
VRSHISEALLFVLFIFRKISVKEIDLRVAFEGENVCGNAVEEPPVVRNDDGTSGKVLKGFFQCAQRVHIDVVGGFVKQQHV